MLTSAVSREPIMLANAVFSRGLITQEDLHQLRVISPITSQVNKLVALIGDTIMYHPFKFDAFITSLRSISAHVKLADKISFIHRLNLVSAELNNLQLISDATRSNAAKSANYTDMCSVLLTELHEKELAEPFLSLLSAYPNAKQIAVMLRTSLRAKDPDSGFFSLERAKLNVLSKGSDVVQSTGQSLSKPKTAETQFTSHNSPAAGATELAMSSGMRRSTVADPTKGMTQEQRSTDSENFHSAEGMCREFPMQRFDSAYLPRTDEIAVKGTTADLTRKSTSEGKVCLYPSNLVCTV